MQVAATTELKSLFQVAEHLFKTDQYADAKKHYFQILSLNPDHWVSYVRLGIIFKKEDKLDIARVYLERAIAIKSDQPSLWIALAYLLEKQGNLPEALQAFKRAQELVPVADPLTAYRMGFLCEKMVLPTPAIQYFNQVIDRIQDAPEQADLSVKSHFRRAMARLQLGDYPAGWADYEARTHYERSTIPKIAGQQWTGQPLEGKTILAAHEQRYGDAIQFVRFVPRLKAPGTRILLQCPTELKRLFQSVAGVDEVVASTDPLPNYDFYVHTASIPAVLKIPLGELAQGSPYLRINDEDIVSKIAVRSGTSLKVGLIWAGKPWPDRSIPLPMLMNLLRHREVAFYSFQLGDRRNDMNTHRARWLLQDLAEQIGDFYDSSLLMKQMDLIITIDTAAAHQAGALGIPVWVMLKYQADWRWMLDRDDSPWYPTMRLFRQQGRSWEEAARKLDHEFSVWVNERTCPRNN